LLGVAAGVMLLVAGSYSKKLVGDG